MLRKKISISGQVQGVGFRPFVFRLAARFALTGTVKNGPEGVSVEVQGTAKNLAAFSAALNSELPPLAHISALHEKEIPLLAGEKAFRILSSSQGLAHEVLISPDVATCDDCLADISDPQNRRYRYPFTNCTNCGPRYSITRSMPYDRASTSMSCFELCPECAAEYKNPLDRRFHAQPNACPVCGPQVWLVEAGEAAKNTTQQVAAAPTSTSPAPASNPHGRAEPVQAVCSTGCSGDDAIKKLVKKIKQGAIAAVKGLGGFHLVCNAEDDASVRRLRQLKNRPHKPLAVMAANLDMARKLARIGPNEAKLLTSAERPIVLCPLLPNSRLATQISPDTSYVGLMLPYTPLHHIILHDAGIPLVMTSGNKGGEPIALGNREALERLAALADVFLLHNRDILIRNDDSVLRPIPEFAPAASNSAAKTASAHKKTSSTVTNDATVMYLRRARGFVPSPLHVPPLNPRATPHNTPTHSSTAQALKPTQADLTGGAKSAPADKAQKMPTILALGAELKNTVCLNRGNEAFVSQHIGDLQNLETSAFQAEIARHLADVLQVKPQALLLDAHPDFANQIAAERNQGCSTLPRKGLQHHFAHAVAVLAENIATNNAPNNALNNSMDNVATRTNNSLAYKGGRALVLALDGTGYAPPELNPTGEIWGGELILACPAQRSIKRIGSLSPLPLPGGEAAIHQPWRIAHAALCELGLISKPEAQQNKAPTLPWLGPQFANNAKTAQVIPQMLERKLNTPYSSSAGRLFDAASALLGLCFESTYEGQAAIRLEEAQFSGQAPQNWQSLYKNVKILPCPLKKSPRKGLEYELDTSLMLRSLYEEMQTGRPVTDLARSFHYSLAEALADLALLAGKQHGTNMVGLSGGVLQNMSLLLLLKDKLRARGLEPLTHHRLPPNDGCISYGQCVWGLHKLV